VNHVLELLPLKLRGLDLHGVTMSSPTDLASTHGHEGLSQQGARGPHRTQHRHPLRLRLARVGVESLPPVLAVSW
jgi:hypothetical protein